MTFDEMVEKSKPSLLKASSEPVGAMAVVTAWEPGEVGVAHFASAGRIYELLGAIDYLRARILADIEKMSISTDARFGPEQPEWEAEGHVDKADLLGTKGLR